MKYSTVSEAFLTVCSKYKDSKIAFKFRDIEGTIQGLTYSELKEKVECLTLGLMELGIHQFDRIGIVSENRLEWIIADLAIVNFGAIDVPVFPTLTAKQIEYIFNNSQVTAVIVSNIFQLKKILEVKENIPSLRHIIVMNDDYSPKDLIVKSISDLITWGQNAKNNQDCDALLMNARAKVHPDDLLTIIYTSGTTGEPKGVMLSHKNVLSNYEGVIRAIAFREDDVSVSYLPLSHSYERTTGYYSLFFLGVTIALADSIDTLLPFIQEIKPTVFTTVPKFLQTVQKKIKSSVEKEGGIKLKIFNWALKTGGEYVRRQEQGKSTFTLDLQIKLADKLVFSKIREKLGGHVRMMASGGAALPDDIHEFFTSLGIVLIQGYGLTETSPVVSLTREGEIEIGTIGKPIFNVEVKIAEDGEILVRGDNVMKGYWADPVATEQAIDEDGWLYTGDIGVFTEKGNIRITDRKKDIFVSSGGKNIAPQPIEGLLSQSKYIDNVILIGERREYCTALITPNYEQLEALAKDFDIKFDNVTELISNSKIISTLKKEIDYLQKDIAKYEKVRKFALLSTPFSIENGELSPKMSVRRHIVEKKYAEIIEQLYKGSD
jgi:long-chain acyl-CoA synthetase